MLGLIIVNKVIDRRYLIRDDGAHPLRYQSMNMEGVPPIKPINAPQNRQALSICFNPREPTEVRLCQWNAGNAGNAAISIRYSAFPFILIRDAVLMNNSDLC